MSSATITGRPAPASVRDAADVAAVHGIDHEARASFQEFVDEHRHLMSDYIARRMRGVPELCSEDALQEALIRMWQQWPRWPQDPERREVYMRQALKVAAIDAIRGRYGRTMSRPREYPVNFADLDRCIPPEPGAHAIVRELGQAIARASLERSPDKRDIERSVLVAAFAALTDFERRVLFMTARSDNGAQIAADLGVRHQLVRETLMRARRLVRSLIEHADAGKISPDEARRLWDLRDGKLSGRPKRDAQRHLDHCTTCQRLAGIEDTVSRAGVRVFLPLPVAAALAGKALALSSASGAAGGASHSAAVGAGAAATGGGLLSGVTAKAAVALGVLALGGSIAGTAKIYRDRDRPAPPAHSTLTARTRAPRSAPPARTPTHAHKHAATRRRTSGTRSTIRSTRHTPTPLQPPAPAPGRASTVTPSTTTASRNPGTSTTTGGEFVLGRP